MFIFTVVIQIAFKVFGDKPNPSRTNSSVHLPGFRCLLPDETELLSISFFCIDCDSYQHSSGGTVYVTDSKFRQVNPTLSSSITDHTNDPNFVNKKF